MTIPSEKINALIKTREFLRSLLDPKQTPKVPKSVRKSAYWCLRHYPWDMDIELFNKVLKISSRRKIRNS